MKEVWWVFWIIVMFGFLIWSSQHRWSCRLGEKGQLHTDSLKRVMVCDGSYWVPYTVEIK